MTFALTLAKVKKLGPCKDRFLAAKAILPARRKIIAAQARKAGVPFSDMVWLARKDREAARRFRHWGAAARIRYALAGRPLERHVCLCRV